MPNYIEGAYDLHVHSAPDVLPRRMDDVDMAQRVIASGMAGYVIKSHYFCTSERAQIINKLFPDCNALGSVTLNSSVGGINPSAMEMACRSGIKLVWFPTCDGVNERSYVFSERCRVMPYWGKIVIQLKEEGIETPLVSVLDDKGELTPETLQVLDIIAKYNIILATGHISHEEAFRLVPEAARRGVRKIVITHVTYNNTLYSLEDQKRLADYGAYMEHCYTTFATGKSTFETELEQIRAMGPDHVVLSTDLGQQTAIFPDEGLRIYCEKLAENGFSALELRKMVRDNQEKLLAN